MAFTWQFEVRFQLHAHYRHQLKNDLSKARYVHGSIVVGDDILVIGGISSDRRFKH